jgi:hypothetical protein
VIGVATDTKKENLELTKSGNWGEKDAKKGKKDSSETPITGH